MKRFSKQELFNIRNKISINLLIKDILKIPSKTDKGRFQFQCPICSGFNTGTMLKTNLARCFQCGLNLNTIEMVMNIKKYDFVASATFLKPYLDIAKKNSITTHGHPSSLNSEIQNSSPMPIQKRSLNEQVEKLSRKLSFSSLDWSYDGTQSTETQMLLQLEKKVNCLSKQVDQLKAFVIREFCKKS